MGQIYVPWANFSNKCQETAHQVIKKGVKALIEKVGTLIRKYVSAPMVILITKLNQVLRGWANYHRHVVSSEVFSRIDTYVYEHLWRMLRKRHPGKSKRWLFREY